MQALAYRSLTSLVSACPSDSVSPPYLHHRLNSALQCPLLAAVSASQHTSKIPSYVLALFKVHIIENLSDHLSQHTHYYSPPISHLFIYDAHNLCFIYFFWSCRIQVECKFHSGRDHVCLIPHDCPKDEWTFSEYLWDKQISGWERESEKDCGTVLSRSGLPVSDRNYSWPPGIAWYHHHQKIQNSDKVFSVFPPGWAISKGCTGSLTHSKDKGGERECSHVLLNLCH